MLSEGSRTEFDMTNSIWLAVLVFYPMVGALICYLVGKKWKNARNLIANFITISEFALTVAVVLSDYGMVGDLIRSLSSDSTITAETYLDPYFVGSLMNFGLEIPDVCGMGIHFAMDGFRSIYALVVAFMWMMVTLLCPEYFAKHRNRNRFYAFLLVTLGATMGVFLSTDFFTTFIFFEIMSLTSYVWVAQEETPEALKAGETYLGISVIGGMVMLMGIFMLWNSIRTLNFSEIANAIMFEHDSLIHLDGQVIAAGICILFGFAVKAGAFPVHIWLPKAHPVAPAPASALLSGVLTKTGIFGIVVVTVQIFQYTDWFGYVLLVIAVITMLVGALLALFSVDLKRVLACSSLSQIGFILTGVAVLAVSHGENVLAARGSLIYMVNHSVLKLVLFMAAGVIYMNTHKLNLNDIKGFGRKKPLLHIAFLLGVLGISGIPFFNGYVGKTLIHEGMLEVSAIPAFVEMLFLLAGGCTLAYMLKLYICIFIEKNNDADRQAAFDEKKKYMNFGSAFALLGSAAVIPFIGLVPNKTADFIMDLGQNFFGVGALEHEVHYFAFHNMKGSLISIAIGVILYVALVRICLTAKNAAGKEEYANYWPKWMDLENLIYRPILIQFIPFLCGVICRVLDSLVDFFVVGLRKTVYKDSALPHELPEGNPVTHAAAVIADKVVWVLNKTFCKKKPIRKSFEHLYAVRWEELAENNQIIGRSLSYGLILFCLGLVLTIIYLMWVILK